jgi:hypothetical protein
MQPDPTSGPLGAGSPAPGAHLEPRGPPLLGALGGCFAGTARVDEVPLRRWTLLVPLLLRTPRGDIIHT